MITEYKNGSMTVTNNGIAHKIADAEYYFTIAMINGNRKRKKHWLRVIEQLKEQLKHESEKTE